MRRVVVALSLLLAAEGVVPLAAAPPRVGLPNTAGALKSWSDAVRTLRIVVEVEGKPPRYGDRERAKLPAGGKYRHGSEWTWADSGKSRHYQWTRDRGKLVRDWLTLFDGRRAYMFKNPHGDPPTNLDKIERTRAIPPGVRKSVCPIDLIHSLNGLYDGNHLTVVELLRARDRGAYRVAWPVAGGEETLLVTRPRITFPRDRPAGKSQTPLPDTETIHVTFDPQHGLLPRVIERGTRQVVTEYKYVERPGVWFPTKGYLMSSGEVLRSWRVTDVKVNSELPESVFRPEIPEGTPIQEGNRTILYVDEEQRARELERSRRWQWWLAWIVGIGVGGVCVWIGVRGWKQIRSRG